MLSMFRVVSTVFLLNYIILAQLNLTGLNLINNNHYNNKYSFEKFKQDYVEGDCFICVDNYEYWGVGVNFKTQIMIERILDKDVICSSNVDSVSYIPPINERNFSVFLQSFVDGNCLHFKNLVPVKFIKIDREYNAVIPSSKWYLPRLFYKIKFFILDLLNSVAHVKNYKSYNFRKTPNGKIIKSEIEDKLYYYAYKFKDVNGNKYVLLGSQSSFDPSIPSDLKTLLGWTLYMSKDSINKFILWDSNIGLRPQKSIFTDLKPIVVKSLYKNELEDYYISNTIPPKGHLLISDKGIDDYNKLYYNNYGQISRWLPIYNKDSENTPFLFCIAINMNAHRKTYFQLGFTLLKDKNDNQLYCADVLISGKKLRAFKEACSILARNRTSSEINLTLKKIIAESFEIDPFHISAKFLKNIYLSDFWGRLLGNKEIAKVLMSEYFNSDPSFDFIFKKVNQYQQIYYLNAAEIQNNIRKYLIEPFPGKCIIESETNDDIDEEYYWVEVDDINIFKNIRFDL